LKPTYDLQPVSDRAFLVRFTSSTDLLLSREQVLSETYSHVRKLTLQLELFPADYILRVQPAYDSVLIVWNPLVALEPLVREYLEVAIAESAHLELPLPHQIQIPLCYDFAIAPDLADVLTILHLPLEEFIALHTEPDYLVYFLGFMPGFPYLGGLKPQIAVPRLDRPREKVPAGSVGIGSDQTGIYPMPSPGGWRLVARTPFKLFDMRRTPMALLSMGDTVKFKSIGKAEYLDLGGPWAP
jgi:inhibitor of KinA